MPSIDDGLNIEDLEHTSQEEIDLYLTRMWRHRGTLYEVSANSVWLDTGPDFAKLHAGVPPCSVAQNPATS